MTNQFNDDEIEDIFTYHAPTEEQREKYQRINEAYIECAKKIAKEMPSGPGKTVAMRKLSEARMSTNQAVALGGRW